MAGSTHTVGVDDRFTVWELLFEVAENVDSSSWVLVGGLMVHAHSLRAGVDAPRPTSDVDSLINTGTSQISAMAGPLLTLGFAPQAPSGGPFHRFVRGTQKVDIMVGNDAPSSARWAGRPVLRAPAAAQAIRRRDWYEFVGVSGRTVTVGVPDPLGAIVAKSAAYEVDSRNPDRHIEDIAVLLAGSGGRRGLTLDTLDTNDRRRIRHIVPRLDDPYAVPWAQLDERDARRGLSAFSALRDAVGA